MAEIMFCGSACKKKANLSPDASANIEQEMNNGGDSSDSTKKDVPSIHCALDSPTRSKSRSESRLGKDNKTFRETAKPSPHKTPPLSGERGVCQFKSGYECAVV